jgi:enterochelin esterase-like enzyme
MIRAAASLLAVVMAAQLSSAQSPRRVASPQIEPGGQVTFRLHAPRATAVTVTGELDGRAHPMTKGEDGVWAVTVGPLAPDIYTYVFEVDGIRALDPGNPNTKYGFGNFGPVSIVQVPGDGPQFYDTKPVPHGEVRIRPYDSTALGVSRTAWIYTPPGYEQARDLPVLYLLHGGGDIESGWTMIGRAHNILDNAIAEKRARPMVVVMPLGHAMQSYWTGPAQAAAASSTASGLSPASRDLVEDLMPLVERTYKVSRRAADRALAGLSMGGGQSVNIAFSRPGLFRHLVLMSPAVNGNVANAYPRVFADPSAFNRTLKLFWIGSGRDDTLTGPGERAFTAALRTAGITHTVVETPGRHEWTVWRHHLRDILPLLFRD